MSPIQTFVCLCICGIQTVQSTLVSFMFCTDCCSVASHLQDDGDVEDDMTIREVRCTTRPSNESVRDQPVNCFGELKNGGTTKCLTSLGVLHSQ